MSGRGRQGGRGRSRSRTPEEEEEQAAADDHHELVRTLKNQIEDKKQRNRALIGGFEPAPFARDSEHQSEAVWARDDAARSEIDRELMKFNLERDQVSM